jgi:hypothetical protein
MSGTTAKVLVRLLPQQRLKVERVACSTGISMTDVIRLAIDAFPEHPPDPAAREAPASAE